MIVFHQLLCSGLGLFWHTFFCMTSNFTASLLSCSKFILTLWKPLVIFLHTFLLGWDREWKVRCKEIHHNETIPSQYGKISTLKSSLSYVPHTEKTHFTPFLKSPSLKWHHAFKGSREEGAGRWHLADCSILPLIDASAPLGAWLQFFPQNMNQMRPQANIFPCQTFHFLETVKSWCDILCRVYFCFWASKLLYCFPGP